MDALALECQLDQMYELASRIAVSFRARCVANRTELVAEGTHHVDLESYPRATKMPRFILAVSSAQLEIPITATP